MVLFHLNADTHVYTLTRNAWVSVDFFFVLSGFVLMSGFGTRVDDGAAFARYSLRRLTRLYPLHLVALTVLVALIGLEAWQTGKSLFADQHGLGALLQCLVLVQGFTTQALSWNFPSWSVSIELWASLGFGLALWLARSKAWIVFVVVTILLFAVWLAFGEPDGPAVTDRSALLKAAHYLLSFISGVILFLGFAWASRGGWRPPTWAEWPALAVVATIFVFADKLNSPETIALFAVVIFVFAFERGRISAWLRGRFFQALGRWSYSIYLIHPLWTIATLKLVAVAGVWIGQRAIINDASGELVVLGGPIVMDLTAIACLALVIATAALTYRFIERPGMKVGKS